MGDLTNADGVLPPSTPGRVDDATVWSTTEEQVTAFVRDRFTTDIAPVRHLGQGAWSRCFGFELDGAERVIRLGAYPADFERDRWTGDRLAETGLPVPRVIEIGEAFSCSYAVATRVTGEPIEHADADIWADLLPRVFDGLEAIHAVDVPGGGFGAWTPQQLGVSASWRDHLLAVGRDDPQSRIPGWRRNLHRVDDAEATFERGRQRLAELTERVDVPRALVHADLLHGNVLATGSDLTGWLDWGASVIGDPLYDLAWLTFWSPWHVGPAAVLDQTTVEAHRDRIADGHPDAVRRFAACRLHIGLDHIAYASHTERFQDLAENVRATAAVITETD